MDAVTVTARRWERGWELKIDPDNITQVRSLDKAAQQVRDYLDTLDPSTDHSAVEVELRPDLGLLGVKVTAARSATLDAALAQAAAAQETRAVVAALRAEHYSGNDIAALLGVSKGRVSQLTNAS